MCSIIIRFNVLKKYGKPDLICYIMAVLEPLCDSNWDINTFFPEAEFPHNVLLSLSLSLSLSLFKEKWKELHKSLRPEREEENLSLCCQRHIPSKPQKHLLSLHYIMTCLTKHLSF